MESQHASSTTRQPTRRPPRQPRTEFYSGAVPPSCGFGFRRCGMRVAEPPFEVEPSNRREGGGPMAVIVEHRYSEAIHPLHAVLLAGTIPLFLGALISDITYGRTFHIQW